MKTKKLMMLLLTTSILIGTTTRVNVFAAEQVNKNSEISTERPEDIKAETETTTTTKETTGISTETAEITITSDSSTEVDSTNQEQVQNESVDATQGTENITEAEAEAKTETETETDNQSAKDATDNKKTTKNSNTKKSSKSTKISNETKATEKKKEAVKASYTKTDVRILTGIIYCEAGYENFNAKLGVANVILNRVKSDAFDHVTSVKEAVYDLKRWGRQFSPAYVKDSKGNWTTEGSSLEKAMQLYVNGNYTSTTQKKMMAECEKAAIAALEGDNNIGNALYFNGSVESTKSMCKKNGKSYIVIDSCIFY